MSYGLGNLNWWLTGNFRIKEMAPADSARTKIQDLIDHISPSVDSSEKEIDTHEVEYTIEAHSPTPTWF